MVRHPVIFIEPYTVENLTATLLLIQTLSQNFFMNFFRSTVFFINFIYNNAWFQTKIKRFCNTKRVWGIGPSKASTSRQTPSAMFTRSTSPPKSA
jgi:hypothetical protein